MMAVNSRNEMSGSVGGGIMEHKFVELAKSKLLAAEKKTTTHQQFHDKAAARNQSGMICSGEQTIFMYPVQEHDQETIGELIRSLEKNQNGSLQLSRHGIRFNRHIPEADFQLEKMDDQHFQYTAKTGYLHHLYIIGGGHVALALSQLMSNLDFLIHLVEERSGLHTLQQNNYVHEKITVGDYAETGIHIPPGKNIYVVVMTVGYRTDKTALISLLGKEIKYLGILGSKTKMKKMFSELLEEKIDPVVLTSIHAPLGISIKSETPQEIAISIAAEIIRVKNRNF